jgi:two-component system chemotaxis response regulator CheY
MELEVRMERDMKILVVDDFSMMRRITRKLLRDIGYTNVAEADDGLTALPMLETEDFDLLITDWDMPGMAGIELLRTIRANPELNDLPVLMVTSEARRDYVLDAEAAGVNGYIVKPYTLEALRGHLDRVCGPLAMA